MREHGRHRRDAIWIGLAASLLLHAGLLVWFFAAREPVVPALAERPYRVELYEAPRQGTAPGGPDEQAAAPERREPRPVAPSPPSPQPSPPASGGRGGAITAAPERAGAPGGAAPAPAGRPRAPGATPSDRPPSPGEVQEWFADRGLGGEGTGKGTGEGEGEGDVAAPLPRDVKRAIQDGPPGSGNARERAERMTNELHASDVARYPDRRWTVLRDRIGQGFAPPEDVVGEGATDGVAGAFVRSYGGYASEYAKTGSPYGRAPDAEGRANEAIASASEMANGPGRMTGGGGVEERMAAAGGYAPSAVVTPGRTAVVAMEQDARGVVIGAWLVRSSGSSRYDALAMKQLEKLRGKVVPAPWGAAITEWAFRTDVSTKPFTPGIGGSFDLGFEGIDFEAPLSTRLKTHPPQLVSIRPVKDGERGPG